MADSRSAASRPLSPHLMVFRFILTMAMSIVHRITGGALYFGAFFVAVWLVAVAMGPKTYALVDLVYSSWFGRLVLLGFVWSLIHHAIGGVRHFIWDLGYGFEKETANRLALWNAILSVALTGLIAVAAFLVG